MQGGLHEGEQQQQHNGARRGGGRDAALTWDVPPLLDAEGAAAAARPAFAAVAAKHLEALVSQLLVAEGVADAAAWGPVICQLAQAAAASLSPTAAVAHGKLDPRGYIKVKRVVTPGASPADSSLVQGVACRKNLAHKRMRSSISQPRIMLLAGGVEVARGGLGGGPGGAAGGAGGGSAAAAAAASKLSSFDGLVSQEQQYLGAAVERIASFNPDVLLVERSVARFAQELLLAKDISLVLNVKLELLERIARCTGALVAPSLDQLTSHCVGFCKEFEVESVLPPGSSAAAAAAAIVSAPVSTDASPRTPEAPLDAQHLVAEGGGGLLRKSATLGAAAASASRPLMLFRGCPRPLGSTIVLRGGDAAELRQVKRVASFAAYAAYWGLLETALLADQLSSAAAAVLPVPAGAGGGSGGQEQAVAGLADAVASTSFLATAEARGRQAIVSASPHVSVILEPGAPAAELELPEQQAEAAAAEAKQLAAQLGGQNGSRGGTEAWNGAGGEGGPPDSPASSDSTNLWVLPAEAGAATFTVSGSQSQTEADEGSQAGGEARSQTPGQQQQQQHRSGGDGSMPAANHRSLGLLDAPGSPQDPLHKAAKELALQQLQLTGSEPPSPVTLGATAAAAGGEPGAGPPPGPQEQVATASGRRDGEAAAVPPRRPAGLTLGLGGEASAASADWGGREGGGGGGDAFGNPGLAAYHTQRLWLSISCKNPAKGILCEPSHAHCMEFYADTDLPLAAFISAAAPPNRKCPHPQCGEGAPLHLRSFMHARGLVTLSSVRLPPGKELPDGRVWMWLRPTGGGGGEGGPSSAAARRVPLSPEAACLSFAHLLSLLLDARHLALGGLSMQRSFVRYLGAGSTLLCLHFSPIQPYLVRMPPGQVQLQPEPELEWLQEEIKQLTEEADEAFSAIEYALGQQLDAFAAQQAQQAAAAAAAAQPADCEEGEAGDGGPAGSEGLEAGADPEFRSIWLNTLADTRAAFLDMVQDTITLLDSSPLGSADAGQQTAHRVVTVVWEMNRLRSMLAAVVLQWATCLHEGTPSSQAAPPSSASALSTALASRRLAASSGHSRHQSTECVQPPGLDGGLAGSPFGQAAAQQAAFRQASGAATPPTPPEQPPEQQQQQAQQQPPSAPQPVPAGPAGRMHRDLSGSSLAHQFIETASAAPAATLSELNFGAPSLVGGDEENRPSSLAGSPPKEALPAPPATIPSGLVARYIAMFDQRGSGPAAGGSGDNSPTGPTVLRSQRTRDWVQSSAPPADDGAIGATPTADQQQQQGEQQQQPLSQPPAPQQAQRGQRAEHRSSLFRLDLSNLDPELVQALTPKQRSTADAELEAQPEAGPSTSRLEQVAARLGRMSLSRSFSERRKSYQQLGHAASADQASLQQQLGHASADQASLQQQPGAEGREQLAAAPAAPGEQAKEQQQEAIPEEGGPAAEGEAEGQDSSRRTSTSHWEWHSLLSAAPSAAAAEEGAAGGGGAGAAAAGRSAGGAAEAGLARLSPLQLLKSASAGRLDAIGRLQEAPMPPDLPVPPAEAQPEAEEVLPAARTAPAAVLAEHAAAAMAGPASRPASLAAGSQGPLSVLVPPGAPSSAASTPLPTPSHPPAPSKQPSKLMQLLGKLRSELAPGHVPLTAGRVELSGRALLPGGADGMRVAIFDEEPTSIVAYFLSTKEYQQYLHDAVAGVLFGPPGAASAAGSTAPATGDSGTPGAGGDGELSASAVPGSWQSLPGSPMAAKAASSSSMRGSSLLPSLQQLRQSKEPPPAAEAGAPPAGEPAASSSGASRAGGSAAAAAAEPAAAGEPAAAAPAAAPAAGQQTAQPQAAAQQASAPPSSRTVTQEELAAEQSGDWQVLFCEQQLDCQLALEDPSPGMPWGRAKFQVTAYYAPQFAELRRRCVAGGEAAFLASISRCRKWASRGGKSSVYFARTHDRRYIVKQLSRSERQSFLEFAPDYFRYVATMLHRRQDTCLAKILGVYQVSVQYTGGRGAPAAPPFGGKEGVMDLLITENVFYGRDAQVSRIYDLKGSQRDRYAVDDPAVAGAVLLDENLKELNLTAPTLVGPRAFARLQRALWSDSGFLSGLGVMDYSLLVGVDKARGELVVGVIDYIRQYTWDKQVETWVKKSGILGGAGKDPTVISPKQYSRRFRIAMSSYLTVVPAWEAPEPPLDPDAM